MNRLFKKENLIVTLSKVENRWNYRKESGSAILENFDFTEDKLASFIDELRSTGYSQDNEKIVEGITDFGVKFKSWYKNELLHREDGPAIEYENGEKHWYINGLLHREGGPAIEGVLPKQASYVDINSKYIYIGKISYQFESWHKEGKLHREDGPAVTYTTGDKFWWENDKFIKRELNLSNSFSIGHQLNYCSRETINFTIRN